MLYCTAPNTKADVTTTKPKAPRTCESEACDPCIAVRRRVLYYAPTEQQCRQFLAEVGQTECDVHYTCSRPRLVLRDHHGELAGAEVCWVMEHSPCSALERLGELYMTLVMLDFRWTPDIADSFDERLAEAMCFLDRLDEVPNVEERYGFHRIVALVSGPDPIEVDRLMTTLGAWGVGLVLRDRGPEGCAAAASPTDPGFAGRALLQALRLAQQRKQGRSALCAAGGGITGIYFELGALKCLADCLEPGALHSFDMYFGISAGAVVTGLLSAGYTVEEIMAAVAGASGGRIKPLSLKLLRLHHVNTREMLSRVGRVLRSGGRRVWQAARRGDGPAADDWIYEYSDVLGPPFHSQRFEAILEELLSVAGVENDFRNLSRPLFIGASDQDHREHVLFGTPGRDDVPISKAIAASLSINPAFAPVSVDGRYYADGAVTRTSNFSEAIRRGANLIFVLDPFVPYVPKVAGFTHRRGLLYNIDQDLRTVSFTRFETARNCILRKHPHVSSYTFLPANRARRLMSFIPMDLRPYLEIWQQAYLSTL